MMKQILVSLACLLCCSLAQAQNNTQASSQDKQSIEVIVRNGKQYYQYIVQPKETIYGLSKRFNITQEELLAMNPFLTEGLKIGQVLTIPVVPAATTSDAAPAQLSTKLDLTPQDEALPAAILNDDDNEPDGDMYQSDNEQVYVVSKRREKLSDISQKFHVSIDSLKLLNPNIPKVLRRNSVIILPNRQEEELNRKIDRMEQEIALSHDSIRSLLDRIQHQTAGSQPKDKISVGLLLPFMVGDTTGFSRERYIEFYEGLLLAADTLKRSGLSVDIAVYDIGKTLYRTEYTLRHNDLSHHDFVIAAANADQLPYLSQWSKRHNVKLVLPFSSHIAETDSNTCIYQVNAPQSMVCDKLLSLDTSRFSNRNIVLLRTPQEANDEKARLFKGIRRQLLDYHIAFHELIEYEGDDDFQDSIAAHLSKERVNLIIPCASSLAEANRIISMVGAVINFLPSAYKTELWGYPEWIALNKSNMPVLHNLNTCIYGGYFANYQREDVRQFQRDYSLSFGKDLMNTFPCYAMMGYDVMVYFSGLASQRTFNIKPLQHEMDFHQTHEQSGWYNQKVFLIYYLRQQAVFSKTI